MNEIAFIFQSIGHLWFASIVQLRTGRIQSLGREGRVIKAVKQTTERSGGRGRSCGGTFVSNIFFKVMFNLVCFFVALIMTECSKPLWLSLPFFLSCPDISSRRHLNNTFDRWKKPTRRTNLQTAYSELSVYTTSIIRTHNGLSKFAYGSIVLFGLSKWIHKYLIVR